MDALLKNRIAALELAIDQAEHALNRAANAMLRGSGTTVADRMDIQDCFQRIREVRLAPLNPKPEGEG